MNSTFRTALILGLLVAVVAGVTLISQFTGGTTRPAPGPGGDPQADGRPTGPPLVFRSAEARYDPDAEDIAYRAFHGFFEVGDAVNWVSFWFRNPNPFPVRVRMGGVSCTSCSSARAAVVPDDALRTYAGRAAWAGLPWSPVPLPDLISPAAYAGLDAGLAWHVFDFARPEDTWTVPAAADGRPAVGVLALGFKAQAVGPAKTVDAALVAAGPDDRAHPYKFTVTFTPRAAFDTYPPEFAVGELPEGAADRTFQVLVYSTTRPPGTLPPPKGRPGNDDPFVAVGEPAPLTAGEADDLARTALAVSKMHLRVASGYRVPVTIRRDVPGRLADVGRFDKTVHFAVPGSPHTAAVVFRGRVTGLVQLEKDRDAKDDEKIDLGTYNSNYTTTKKRDLFATRSDLELELDQVKCEPAFARYALSPPRTEGSRKYWTITVTIPPQVGRKPAWEGVVFLKATGKDGTRANIRLPVAGNGIGR